MSALSITQKKGSRFLFVAAIFSLVLSSVVSPLVSAATSASDMTPTELAKSYAYATAITKCFKDGTTSTKESDVTSGKIFSGEPNTKPTFTLFLQGVGVSVDNDKYAIKCKDATWVKDAAALWGISTTDIMCGAGFVRSSGHTDCKNGTGNFKNSVTSGAGGGVSYQNSQKFQDYIKKTVYNNEFGQPNLGVAATYAMAFNAFKIGCLGTANPSGYSGSASNSDKYLYQNIKVVDPSTGESKATNFYATSENKKGKDEKVAWRMDGTLTVENSCQELAGIINSNAAAYRTAILALIEKGKDDSSPNGTNIDCRADENKDDPSCAEEGAATCTIDGIGWLLCPVVNLLANISDASKDKLGEFLQVGSSMFTDRGAGTVYDYWQKILTYANILFVIVFLVVIYSQITGAGISNYGIKKMVPKMIVGVILVNLSFYLCALLVDLSNLAGNSAFGFITSIGSGSTGATTGSWISQGNTFSDIALGILAGAATLYFALSALIAGLIFIAIIAVTTVFLLGVRQALIIFLVIVSPLAFVAMLLPNTESLYKKWWMMFKSLLLLYPIIGIVYGASSLASHILNPTTSGTDPDFLLEIIAGVLMFAPLLLVPTLVKKAMSGFGVTGIMDKIGGKTRGFANNKAQAAIKDSTLSRFRENNARRGAARSAAIRGGAYTGRNPLRKLNSGLHKKLNTKLGNYGDRAEAIGAKVADDQDAEDMKMAEARLDNTTFVDTRSDGSKEITKLGQSQHMQIALGENVTDSSGNVVMSAKNFTAHDRRVAAQKAASIATTSDAIKLAQATSARDSVTGDLKMSASERANISSSLASSKAVAKSPYLAGPSIADMQNGTFDLGESVIRAADSGKVTAEAVAMTDATSSATIKDELMKANSSRPDVQRARDNVRTAATEALGPNSRVREKIVGNSNLYKNIDDMRKL